MSSRLPDFLVIGAAKSGTTSLHRYLRQHPEVFMSELKEPHFFVVEGREPDFRGPADRRAFNRNSVHDLDAYRALFAGAGEAKAVGEASPSYLFCEHSPESIRRHLPEVRLIAILRHPAERAYSDFVAMTRNRWETVPTLVEALELEQRRQQLGWGPWYRYLEKGFYARHLRRFLEHFPREQLLVLLFDDLLESPSGLFREVFGFLDVDPDFAVDDSGRFNVSGWPRFAKVSLFLRGRWPLKGMLRALAPAALRHAAFRRLDSWNLERRPMPTATRQRLLESYAEDIRQLEPLLDRDLSRWLT